MQTVDRTLIRVPIAKIKVDTLFYTGAVEAMCLKDPLFDLIIGNDPEARKPNDPNSEWGIVAAALTRAQAQERENLNPLQVKKMTSKMAVNEEELIRLQEEDSTLQKFKEAKRTKTRKVQYTEFLMKNLEEFANGYVSERMKWEMHESELSMCQLDQARTRPKPENASPNLTRTRN